MNIRTLCTVILLMLILFTAFLVRIQGAPNIPEGQFTGTDAYFYYRYPLSFSLARIRDHLFFHRRHPFGDSSGQYRAEYYGVQ